MLSSELNQLLRELRGDPRWERLLKEIPVPQLPRYRASDSADPQRTHDEWVYQSGRLNEHESLMAFLTNH